ncbi:hypothetical protein GH714_002399 [Hevea brasiliensis]|uniref:Lipoxygenase domain-containing protein n=1 Tax=Hevea brasiliensis TaxID=3981 RepID=A0A6A6L8G5_HEVBR|nr:hypothetical protein GH714_002399 [Hevea brasiliensis]
MSESITESHRFDAPKGISGELSCLRDDEFGRLTLRGMNPFSIERPKAFPPVSKLNTSIYGPPESAVEEEHIIAHLNGMSVQQGIGNSRPAQVHGLRLVIEDYPYANDGLLIWSAIGKLGDVEYEHFLADPGGYYLSSLPSLLQVTHFMSVLDILSTHAVDKEYVGARKDLSTWSGDIVIIEAFYGFSMEMKKIEKEIEKRNSDPTIGIVLVLEFYLMNCSYQAKTLVLLVEGFLIVYQCEPVRL